MWPIWGVKKKPSMTKHKDKIVENVLKASIDMRERKLS